MTTDDGVAVRRATADDLAAAYAVRAIVFVDEQDVPPELERDEEDETADHVVAVAAGRVVGTARLVREGDVGVVGRMAVLSDARGRRIGARLLAALEDIARERGLAEIALHAQVHACGFYARAGYAPVGDEYDEAGIRHVTMTKRL